MSVISNKFLLKLALRMQIFLKLSHASTLSMWTKNMANAKICVLLYSFCFVLFWIWGQFPSTSPGAHVFGGAIYQTFFCIMSLGGLYLDGFIHGVAYFQNFTVFHVCKCTLAYLSRDQNNLQTSLQTEINIDINACTGTSLSCTVHLVSKTPVNFYNSYNCTTTIGISL